MRTFVAVLGVGAVALALAAASSARPAKTALRAPLSAAQEVPAQVVANTAAKGLFTGTLVGTKLRWKLTFSGLTGPATAAHLHTGVKGKAGNVIVPLCGPCRSGMTGVVTISAAMLQTIRKHGMYVNVHTAKNPAGEIRGQLAAKG